MIGHGLNAKQGVRRGSSGGRQDVDAMASEGDEFEQRTMKLRCHGQQEVGRWF